MSLPKWERLSESLRRVMATGVPEGRAKRAICNAIVDRKVRLRLHFTWRSTSETFLTGRDQPTSKVHCLRNEEISSELGPGDFDWQRSRIRKPGLWQNVRGPGSFFANWRVIETAHYGQANSLPDSQRGGRTLAYRHRLELRSADVTKNLIEPAEHDRYEKLERALAQLLPNLGPKQQAVAEIMLELGLKRILQSPTAKDRNKLIIDGLKEKGHGIREHPQRTIQRVLALLPR
jgi:hypothetical protein